MTETDATEIDLDALEDEDEAPKKGRAKKKLPKYLEPADWNAVFATVDKRTPTGKRDLALYLLMWRTGLRVGEAINLRLSNFNLKTGRLRVPAEGKTGERIVWAPVDAPRLRDAIDAWMEARAEWDPDGQSPYFFINRAGNQLDPRQVRATLERRGKKAGIAIRVTPHMLRHSFATDLLKEGASIIDVRDALGHASVATTQVYEHLLSSRLEGVMGKRTDF